MTFEYAVLIKIELRLPGAASKNSMTACRLIIASGREQPSALVFFKRAAVAALSYRP